MSEHPPIDPGFEARTRASFARQQVMDTLGARMTHVTAGECEIELPFRTALTQQHGFLHAGVVATLLDSACGYAAFTLMPADAGVLTIEFKINLLAPARGDTLLARGTVKRAGRSVIVGNADGYMLSGGERRLVATMIGTLMCIQGRADVTG